VFVAAHSKVKHLDTELHVATTTLKSLELSESKVTMRLFVLIVIVSRAIKCD